jgi:hypothetical protein
MCLAVDTSVSVAMCSVRQCISQAEVDWGPVFVTCVISQPIEHTLQTEVYRLDTMTVSDLAATDQGSYKE